MGVQKQEPTRFVRLYEEVDKVGGGKRWISSDIEGMMRWAHQDTRFKMDVLSSSHTVVRSYIKCAFDMRILYTKLVESGKIQQHQRRGSQQ